MNRFLGTSGRRLCWFVVLIASTSATATLSPEPYRITHGEFQVHCQVLGFDPQQLASARAMFEAHTIDFDRTCAVYLAIESWARSNTGSQVGVTTLSPNVADTIDDDLRMLGLKFHLSLQELEEQYFFGLSSILGNQSDAVGGLERRHLRRRIIGHRDSRLDGDTYGASLDLASILQNSQFRQIAEEDAAIRKILEQYTLELDSILQSLDDISPNYKRDAEAELRVLRNKEETNSMESGELELLAEQFASAQGYSHQIRSLNKITAIKLAEVLPSELSDEFTIEVNEKLYAYMFADRLNYAKLLMKARRGLPSQPLDNELAEGLHALLDAERNAITYVEPLYDEMLSPANRKAAWEAWVAFRIEGTVRPYQDPRAPVVQRYKDALLRYKANLQPLDQFVLQLLEKSNMQTGQEDGG